ncbi:hypothetical protein L1049_019766 [Liquidambar formosana]|uniref:Uncharacterized protein n=1 Tax=Liquidambar formosana TaxID=63359 RepID=A0AAP0S6R2_LIQFO
MVTVEFSGSSSCSDLKGVYGRPDVIMNPINLFKSVSLEVQFEFVYKHLLVTTPYLSLEPHNRCSFASMEDFREEYANAFRTESYIAFWTHVLTLNHGDSATCIPVESTTAARLSSYRLFVEHLLDPDQPTVTRILQLSQNQPKIYILLSDYFSETADASVLCGLLLKDIDRARVKFRDLKASLDSLGSTQMLTRLTQFSKSFNPFVSSASSKHRFQAVQASCSGLLKRLESGRDKARAKLRLINKVKIGSAIFLVALTASLAVIATAHALAMVVAGPGYYSCFT